MPENVSGISTADKPFVFFFDFKEIKQSLKLCVKDCPQKAIVSPRELYSFYQVNGSQLCRYDFDMSRLEQVSASDQSTFDFTGPCPTLPIHESSPLVHRCIPTGKNAPYKEVAELYTVISNWDIIEQTGRDLYKSWHVIIIVCVISLVFSVILVGLLHYLTQIISWLICIFVAIASIAITALLWYTYYDLRKKKEMGDLSSVAQIVQNETAVYVFAIIATIAMIVLLVVIYFLSSKFAGLAALFEEAGKCMYSIPQIFGPPLLACIAFALFITFWISVVVCLSTATVPGFKPLLNVAQLANAPIADSQSSVLENIKNTFKSSSEAKKSFRLVEYHETHYLKYMLWVYLVALIWVSEFIFAASQLALAGAVALWYFKKPTDSPVCDSLAKLVQCHLGSVAKGSFLITLFKIPRLILTYMYTKLKAAKQNGNDCADCGLKGCICCFYCLETFMRYLNHNAYTVIAIESINFCPAAGVAWKAIWTHVVSVATINGIGDFVLFLAKLAVAGVGGCISLVLLKRDEEVQLYIFPVLIISLFSFFIAHMILSLYEIVVDTLFLCVYEDRTINGPAGRWKDSNLANLLGEERIVAVEGRMQEVELRPITKQPFGWRAEDQQMTEQA